MQTFVKASVTLSVKLLIPLSELDNYGCREDIPLSCERCNTTFVRPKNMVCRAIKGTRSITYCSKECHFEAIKKKPVSFVCSQCGKPFERMVKKSKIKTINYCSRKCAASGSMTKEHRQKFIELRDKQSIDKGECPYPHTNIEYFKCKICSKTFAAKRHSKRVCCSDKCRSKLYSDKCKTIVGMCKNNNKHAGWYESPIAGRVWLESTWEVQCAQIFDKHNVKWSRPRKGFLWVDANGKNHHYYPDFYLTNEKVYLDPKNPYLQERDMPKINDVRQRHGITILILGKAELEEKNLLTLINKIGLCQ